MPGAGQVLRGQNKAVTGAALGGLGLLLLGSARRPGLPAAQRRLAASRWSAAYLQSLVVLIRPVKRPQRRPRSKRRLTPARSVKPAIRSRTTKHRCLRVARDDVAPPPVMASSTMQNAPASSARLKVRALMFTPRNFSMRSLQSLPQSPSWLPPRTRPLWRRRPTPPHASRSSRTA